MLMHDFVVPKYLINAHVSQKMLCLDPSRRIPARNALGHEYFKDLGMVP